MGLATCEALVFPGVVGWDELCWGLSCVLIYLMLVGVIGGVAGLLTPVPSSGLFALGSRDAVTGGGNTGLSNEEIALDTFVCQMKNIYTMFLFSSYYY